MQAFVLNIFSIEIIEHPGDRTGTGVAALAMGHDGQNVCREPAHKRQDLLRLRKGECLEYFIARSA